MEDRYLFRGKGTDNREWAIGNLIHTFTGTPYIVTEYDHIMNFIAINEIDPTTICQCTGLKDKNSKPIWENDIVKVKYSDGFEEIAEVAYTEHGYTPYSNEYECEGCCCRCEVLEIEVIGNKFDNKDLLEKEFFK